MVLYDLKGQQLSLVDTNAFALEKEIQVIVENNTEVLFELRFVASEFSVDKFRFDSVCFDDESKSFVIIEYKKDHSFSIIDQGFSYLSTMLQNKSDFILEYNEALGKTLKRNEVDWSQSRIIFVSTSFSIHQKNSINFKNMPFELWEIQRYSNNVVSFNQYSSSSNESIKSISKTPIIAKVNEEIKTYDISDLLEKSSERTKVLWDAINQKLSGADFTGTTFIDRKGYRRFLYENNTTICEFRFRKNNIKIKINGGVNFGDGSKGKYYVELIDYKNIMIKKEELWPGYHDKHGGRNSSKDPINVSYDLVIDDVADVNYLTDLVRQKYEAFIRN